MHLTIEYSVTAIVCLISAVVIQRIFVKERARSANPMAIEGIKWFGLAIFAWGLGGLLNLILIKGFDWNSLDKLIIYTGVSISIANSLFILLSLPSIQHQKKRGVVVRLVQKLNTWEFVGLYCGVLLMISFVFVATSYSNSQISNNFIWLIDIPISLFVAMSLLYELNNAFISRQMKFMYLPTFTLFILIIVAVTQRIIPQDRALQILDQEFWIVVGSITSVSFKFLFILLFSILLYSWKFLTEKEQQQTLAEDLLSENEKLKIRMEHLELSADSHLDTIKIMKQELRDVKEGNEIIFSKRQKEVLGNLARYGKSASYPEIAAKMYISIDGFQTHVHQIKKILKISGSEGKKQLIEYGRTNGFLEFASPNEDVQPHA